MTPAWREWSSAAFAQAEAEKKPILLSLVTAWSDECAAMDQTTYADPAVVALIEARFVPIRLDADRRPDLNDRYNLGGWPTTAFLTASGDMLSGATYLSAAQMIDTLNHVYQACLDRAAEIDERRAVVRSVRAAPDRASPPSDRTSLLPDHTAVDYFSSLLIERFDPMYGGFGSGPKLPHPYALLFALSVSGDFADGNLTHILDMTLDRVTELWDPIAGGFHRYADGQDWTHPGAEKLLEDNAALLHVYVEAAVRGRRKCGDSAAALVRWARSTMSDSDSGGFYNAQTSHGVDKTMYVDRNAMMVGAFIRAAALFDDIWLRDFALKTLEAVIIPAYRPGDGVAHVGPSGAAPPVRGLLTDQIHVAGALVWAHAATGQLPYSMLAAELMEFAIRKMWDERAGAFRDRVASDDPIVPFELNCHAACILDRLSVLTGDGAYRERAHSILQSLSAEYVDQGLFGAAYALAVREVVERHPPAGLELSRVDWQL